MTSIPSVCKIENCNRIGYYDKRRGAYQLLKGLCPMHYQRQKAGQHMGVASKYDIRKCIIKANTALVPVRYKDTICYSTIDIDDVGIAEKYNWFTDVGGYAVSSKGVFLHKIVYGEVPTGKIVDHKDRNKMNNQRSNLREATQAQNCMNRSPNKGSKFKGIVLSHRAKLSGTTKGKIWWAYITHEGKQHSLGMHSTAEEAARAYDKAAKEYFGEYAYLNFPNE